MRKKTDNEQLLDIVGMYYDIKIIKNNSSEVSDSFYGFFLQVLVSFATVCILTANKYINKNLKMFERRPRKQFLHYYASISWL